MGPTYSSVYVRQLNLKSETVEVSPFAILLHLELLRSGASRASDLLGLSGLMRVSFVPSVKIRRVAPSESQAQH